MNKLNQYMKEFYKKISQEEKEGSIKELMSSITKGDPIKEKWISDFFKYKSKNLNSNLSLDQYCQIMERDDKLKNILK